jgi:hypothetical protein
MNAAAQSQTSTDAERSSSAKPTRAGAAGHVLVQKQRCRTPKPEARSGVLPLRNGERVSTPATYQIAVAIDIVICASL